MKLLLSNARVFDPFSSHHSAVTNILIEDGRISKIRKSLTEKNSVDLTGYLIAPGFVDLFANFNEPGFEHKEDITSGIESAVFGGFTDVCLIPNTYPVIESKSDVSFLKSRSGSVDLHPIAAISEGTNGENLTEILDLHQAGAIAFSDGLHPIWNSELLLKALQYVQKFNGLIIDRSKDVHLSQFAQMHEGSVSTALGLKGEPGLSEELILRRNIEILKYAGGRMHFTHLSTAKGVEIIKAAKKGGLLITCDVAIHQLLYSENNLTEFDSNYKVDPPFRSQNDRKALIAGLKSGVIDAIVSSHQPQDPENKDLEFDLALPGINSLPTFFAQLIQLQPELPFEIAINKITAGPRAILGLEEIKIEEGSPAKLAVLDKNEKWVFNQLINPSKSVNSPLFGQELRGRCKATVNGKVFIKN